MVCAGVPVQIGEVGVGTLRSILQRHVVPNFKVSVVPSGHNGELIGRGVMSYPPGQGHLRRPIKIKRAKRKYCVRTGHRKFVWSIHSRPRLQSVGLVRIGPVRRENGGTIRKGAVVLANGVSDRNRGGADHRSVSREGGRYRRSHQPLEGVLKPRSRKQRIQETSMPHVRVDQEPHTRGVRLRAILRISNRKRRTNHHLPRPREVPSQETTPIQLSHRRISQPIRRQVYQHLSNLVVVIRNQKVNLRVTQVTLKNIIHIRLQICIN